MDKDFIVRDSIVADMPAIFEISHTTWLVTYPNEEEGITVEDVETVFDVDKNSVKYKQAQKRRVKRYSNPRFHVWVAESDGKITGFCSAVKEENVNRIMAIYVLPGYQGKGIGKSLIREGFKWLGKDKDILVNVARYNNGSIRFYEKMGFKNTEREGVFDDIARLPTGKVIPEIQMVRTIS